MHKIRVKVTKRHLNIFNFSKMNVFTKLDFDDERVLSKQMGKILIKQKEKYVIIRFKNNPNSSR